MTLGKRVAEARRALGREWTQEKVRAELVRAGLARARSWVANLETDRVRNLNAEETTALEKVLKKPSGYFDEQAAPSGVDIGTLANIETYVSVLGTVSADRFAFSLDAIPEEKIPNPYGSKKVFALRVVGDCMERTFRDGEYIYFSTTQPVADNKIVLARLDGEHTIKRYFKRADGIELRPDNPKYKSRTYSTNKLEIIAVAIGRYAKL